MPPIETCGSIPTNPCSCYNNVTVDFGLDLMTGFNTVKISNIGVSALDLDISASDFLSENNLLGIIGVEASTDVATFGSNGSVTVGIDLCYIGSSSLNGDLRLSITAALTINATTTVTTCKTSNNAQGFKAAFDFNIMFTDIGLQDPDVTIDTSNLSPNMKDFLANTIASIEAGATDVVNAIPDKTLDTAINTAADAVETLIQSTVNSVIPTCTALTT